MRRQDGLGEPLAVLREAQADVSSVLSLIKSDIRRRLVLEGVKVNWPNALLAVTKPGVLCIVAYRISSFLHQRNFRLLSRILDDLQHLYTGIELHFGAEIGPGFVLGDRPGGGISEHVTIGRNCTVLGSSTMTLNADGIDLTKGRIYLGDHCIIGVGARIIGSVTLGPGTQVKPNAVVLNSSPTPGGILEGMPAVRRSIVDLEAVRRWNPLRCCMMEDRELAAAP